MSRWTPANSIAAAALLLGQFLMVLTFSSSKFFTQCNIETPKIDNHNLPPTDCEAALPGLVNKMRDDPEFNALRPLTVEGHHFPGLDESMHLNYSILLLGDSTFRSMANLIPEFQEVMQNRSLKEQHGFHKLPNLNLTEANQNPLQPDLSNQKGHVPRVARLPLLNAMPGKNNVLKHAWKLVEQRQAEIVGVNQGLHWLHFLGEGREIRGEFIYYWIHYKQWLQSIVENAIKIPSIRLLLFKTTNRVCSTEKFVGRFARGNDLYTRKDNETLATCVQLAEKYLNETEHGDGSKMGASREELARYCEFGMLNAEGSNFLNQQLWEFYHDLKRNKTNILSQHNISFTVFNDHDMEDCDYTVRMDGRHFVNQTLARIRMLGNTIDCMLNV